MGIPLFLILLVEASGMSLGAEQPATAAEACGLTGGYPFGNNSHLLKGDEWDPQVAALR